MSLILTFILRQDNVNNILVLIDLCKKEVIETLFSLLVLSVILSVISKTSNLFLSEPFSLSIFIIIDTFFIELEQLTMYCLVHIDRHYKQTIYYNPLIIDWMVKD